MSLIDKHKGGIGAPSQGIVVSEELLQQWVAHESEGHCDPGQPLVDHCKGFELWLDLLLLSSIKQNLCLHGAIHSVFPSPPNNFDWVKQIDHNIFLDLHSCPATWGIDSSRSSNLPSNFPLSEDEHLLARKLFFKLSDESLLNLVEFDQEAQRHENHNRTQSWTDFDLFRGVEVQFLEDWTKAGIVHLQVIQSLSYFILKGFWGLPDRFLQLFPWSFSG